MHFVTCQTNFSGGLVWVCVMHSTLRAWGDVTNLCDWVNLEEFGRRLRSSAAESDGGVKGLLG